MKIANNTKSRFSIVLLSILSVLLLAGCAGMGTTGSKYMNERTFQVNRDINIQEATDMAALALQDMEVTVTEQSGASGFLAGKLVTGWWVNRMSFFVEVYISTPGKQQVKVHASAVAGPEVAFTDELDDIVEDFYEAYEKRLSN